MVVAVVAVGVVEPAIDDVVGVVTVRDRLVSAARPVDVTIFMRDRLASAGILFVHLQAMLVIVVFMFVVHVAIMQVVDVVSVFDLGVAAVFTVLVVVTFMLSTFFVSHDPFPFFCRSIRL